MISGRSASPPTVKRRLRRARCATAFRLRAAVCRSAWTWSVEDPHPVGIGHIDLAPAGHDRLDRGDGPPVRSRPPPALRRGTERWCDSRPSPRTGRAALRRSRRCVRISTSTALPMIAQPRFLQRLDRGLAQRTLRRPRCRTRWTWRASAKPASSHSDFSAAIDSLPVPPNVSCGPQQGADADGGRSEAPLRWKR